MIQDVLEFKIDHCFEKVIGVDTVKGFAEVDEGDESCIISVAHNFNN